MNGVSDKNKQKAYLSQKLRLAYLHNYYFPDLLDVELHKRLRLELRAGSKKLTDQEAKDRGIRFLPNEMVPASVRTDSAFKKRVLTNPENRNFIPNKGLERDLCNALGDVFSSIYSRHEPASETEPKPDNPFAVLKPIIEHNQNYRKIADFLYSGTYQPAEIFHNAACTQVQELIPGIDDNQVDGELGKDFLRGKVVPSLKFVSGGFTIARSIEKRLLDDILIGRNQAYLVTGAAGDGKSTMLYRLAHHLLDKGWRVLFKHETNWLEKIDWQIGVHEAIKTIVLVDRAETLKSLNELHSWLATNHNVILVLAARDIDWKKRTDLEVAPLFLKIFRIKRLDENETGDLAELLFHSGVVEGAEDVIVVEDRLRHSVEESKYPHMLAAMMSACSNTEFENILETLVDGFEPKSLLRWVVLGSAIPHKEASPFFLTGKLIWRLFCQSSDDLSVGREKFEKIYENIRSEIIHLHSNQYDLRHPDITEFSLSRIYGAEYGKLQNLDGLASDLTDILHVAYDEMSEETGIAIGSGTSKDICQLARNWWLSDRVHDHTLGRRLFDALIKRVGNIDRDRKFKALLLKEWLNLEESETDAQTLIEIQQKLLPVYFQVAVQLHQADGSNGYLEDVYKRRLIFANNYDSLGDLHDPDKNSARGIFRAMWEGHNGDLHKPDLVHFWAGLDKSNEGLGAPNDPVPFTHRWAYRELLREAGEGRELTGLLGVWINLEKTHENIGFGKTPKDFTARDICRSAWQEPKIRQNVFSSDSLPEWAHMEESGGNYGDEKSKFSARWIFTWAWKKRNGYKLFNSKTLIEWAMMESRAFEAGQGTKTGGQDVFRKAWKDSQKWFNPEVIAEWGRMEEDTGNYGDEKSKFSARWIFTWAWKKRNSQSLFSSKTLIEWAMMESRAFEAGQGTKTGGQDVFRKAWKDSQKWFNSKVIAEWGRMEAEAGNFEDETEEFSTLWIFKTALHESNRSRLFSNETSKFWVNLELQRQNYGEWKRKNPNYHSARWVATQTNLSDFDRKQILAYIASYDEHVGDFENPAPETARQIWRELLEEEGVATKSWAKFEYAQEKTHPRIGKYSARWIYDRWLEKAPQSVDLHPLESWLQIEGD